VKKIKSFLTVTVLSFLGRFLNSDNESESALHLVSNCPPN